VSPLCSRNARPQKALVGCAQWGTHPSHPGAIYTSKLGRIIFGSLAAALLGKWRVSARQGWAGDKSGLFEHPAIILTSAPMEDPIGNLCVK
jgi:hypothetical protein